METLMRTCRPEVIKGWLLCYVSGSIPLLMVYAMGLSGWFFEYPIAHMVTIFLLLASPLLLILLRHPKAPLWNIGVLWTLVILMGLRSISVFLLPVSGEEISSEELPVVVMMLSVIVSISIGWAMVWTMYFRGSVRVRNTFC